MGVKYQYIDRFLEDRGLKMPQLNVLTPDHEHYTAILYQHKGDLTVTTGNTPSIRNRDQSLASKKHIGFFEIALQTKSDLILNPEYACPLNALGSLLEKGLFPEEKCLMVLCCESITSSELKDFIECHQSVDTQFLIEERALNTPSYQFLDPVIYLFNTRRSTDNKLIKILTFQFKTYYMGATHIESEFMALGTARYIIRNNEESIYLATIICSESLQIDLENDLRQFRDKPYLLVHPQLNNSPRGESLKHYRTKFFSNSSEDIEKDIICLNWAKESMINDITLSYSHSAIYTKAKKILIDDERITQNDKFGLYYNCWKIAHASVLVFDEKEAIFQFENTKTSKRSLNVQNQARFGPVMRNRWYWDEKWTDKPQNLQQELGKCCLDIGGDFDLLLSSELDSINRERLLSLATGNVHTSKWTSPDGNKFFEMGNDEHSYRINVFQDPVTKKQKIEWLNKYATLATSLIRKDELIPQASFLKDLIDSRELSYQRHALNYNLNSSTDVPACMVYVGDSDPIRVRELRATLLYSFPNDNVYSQRLLIIYQHLGELKVDYDDRSPKIAENNNHNPVSINKTKI